MEEIKTLTNQQSLSLHLLSFCQKTYRRDIRCVGAQHHPKHIVDIIAFGDRPIYVWAERDDECSRIHLSVQYETIVVPVASIFEVELPTDEGSLISV